MSFEMLSYLANICQIFQYRYQGKIMDIAQLDNQQKMFTFQTTILKQNVQNCYVCKVMMCEKHFDKPMDIFRT